jgi:hypothetical protein
MENRELVAFELVKVQSITKYIIPTYSNTTIYTAPYFLWAIKVVING